MKISISRTRRYLMAAVVFSALTVAAPSTPIAASWPNQPINITVGFAPGGGTDIVIRSISRYLQDNLGQPVVVTNRPGASGILAANAVANSEPDGYNLFGSDGGALVLNGALYSKLSYDTQKDFDPVSMVIRAPLLVVAHPDFKPSNLSELVALSKQQSLSYASVGQGTHHHLAAELVNAKTGIVAQDIPHKGAAPATQSVLAGHIPFMVVDTIVALPHIRAGKLKVLASLTPTRLAELPDVPTAAEQGYEGLEAYAWIGVVAPKGTPQPVLERLAVAISEVLAMPQVAEQFTKLGMEPRSTTPKQFREFIESEIQRWHPLIKSLELRLD